MLPPFAMDKLVILKLATATERGVPKVYELAPVGKDPAATSPAETEVQVEPSVE